ncbi:YukJ family protein [Alloacidobacterium dinghuense]|uniref:YukJ family protein n=1 Tax=Alloacidobacterium dinghuense TaxID=2763107 RepID=A0A7G8BIB9_9BACT|nr:YukJ family protein [Alloacidobacterium dinghuense]QNI32289.1 YukJ family protein [Alloacidobacterium dinghuense]
MPVYQYSVLKGDPQSGSLSPDSHPHYLINVDAGGTTYQVAVNIESTDGSQVLYFINENFTPPDAGALDALAVGMTQLSTQGNPAVDYVRSTANGQPIVTLSEMQLLPLPGQSASSNLQNAVIQYLNQAIADDNGTIYAFGSQYTDGTGIHDIHMNQGNPPGAYEKDNGIWQDGLLVFELPASGTWAAIFIAFQTESWTTDSNGNPQ